MTKINFVNGQAPALNDETLNQLQNNIETEINNIGGILNNIGLGSDRLPRLASPELNELELNGFAYVTSPTVNGISRANGYLLQLTYAPTYKIQFWVYSSTDDRSLYMRRMLNNVWEDFDSIV